MVPLKRTLKLGSRGSDVRAMKRGLARAPRKGGGHYLKLGKGLTPLFGPYARKALKRYQRDHGLKPDGVYGKNTHRKLEKHFDEYARELMRAYKPKPPKPKGGKVVAIAAGEVGTRETPDGSNTGPRVRQYQAATALGGTGWPWCAAFVVWCWTQAYGSVPRATAGAWDLTDNGGTRVTVAGLKPGDAVSYNTGTGHVNLFVRDLGDRIETIGGNESNSVRRSTWPKSMIHSCARHPAASSAPQRVVSAVRAMSFSLSATVEPPPVEEVQPSEYDQADYDANVQAA